MEMIPDLFPHRFSGVADTNYLSDVNSFFRVWYEENHRFPANEIEFREAMRKGPATLAIPHPAGSNKPIQTAGYLSALRDRRLEQCHRSQA